MPNACKTTPNFLTGSPQTYKWKSRQSRTSRTLKHTLTSQWHPQKNPNSLLFINSVSTRNKASCFWWVAAELLSAMQLFAFFELFGALLYRPRMNSKLTKVSYNLSISAIKKLAEAAKVPEQNCQAMANQTSSFGRSTSPCRTTFLTPNLMYRHPMWSTTSCHVATKLTNIRKPLLCSCHYKEAEPLTCKDSAEVTKVFQLIYERSPMKWP